MVFGTSPVNLIGWEDNDEDLMLPQDTSLAGQLVEHWELRTDAQEAALKEVASSKLRRLVAYKKSLSCTGIHVGAGPSFTRTDSQKLSPLAGTCGETGATATFQSQTFKVDPYCARKRMNEKYVNHEARQNLLHRGDPWMSQPPDRAAVVQVSEEVMRKPLEVLDVGQVTGS